MCADRPGGYPSTVSTVLKREWQKLNNFQLFRNITIRNSAQQDRFLTRRPQNSLIKILISADLGQLKVHLN